MAKQVKIEKAELSGSEKKKLIIKIILFVLLAVGFIVSYVFNDKIFGEKSVFNQALTENALIDGLFQKIPAVIKTLRIFIIAYLINLVLKLIIKKTLIKSNKSKTIFNLVQSFLKWIIAIVTIIMVLAAWGVDTTTLLASAGILTLVIGLGAQSLVADIVAGIFIVFEGEFQVGDIVVIEGWRGTVSEIGMRVTKVEDAGGNIQIINNSQITKIINQTVQLSVAKCTMSIEYSESIEKVEILIRDYLDVLKAKIPSIIEGPFYKGVNSLSASSVDLLFVAKCKEEDIYQVQRELNRELKLMFDRENISIPFTQVVVHEPTGASSSITAKMAKEAYDFAKEQQGLSKYIEEKQ